LRIARQGRPADRIRPGDAAVIVRTHDQGATWPGRCDAWGSLRAARTGDGVRFGRGDRASIRPGRILAPGDRVAVHTALATGIIGVDAAGWRR